VEKFQKYFVEIRYGDIGSKSTGRKKFLVTNSPYGIETLFPIETLNARNLIIPNIKQGLI